MANSSRASPSSFPSPRLVLAPNLLCSDHLSGILIYKISIRFTFQAHRSIMGCIEKILQEKCREVVVGKLHVERST